MKYYYIDTKKFVVFVRQVRIASLTRIRNLQGIRVEQAEMMEKEGYCNRNIEAWKSLSQSFEG
jgi:hypothetical protein